MKKLLFAVIAAASLITLPALAQKPDGGPVQIWKMWTSGSGVIVLPGGAATNISNAVIDTRYQDQVTLEITLNPKTTATDAKGFFFQPSIDGSTLDTTGFWLNLAPSGVAGQANTIVTNIPTYGAAYLAMTYATNASAAAGQLTNCTVRYRVKPGSKQ